MAMSARATNIGGTMIAEKRNGVRRYHGHDSQGNTVALVDDDGKITDSFGYWPYGEVRVITGSASSTPFKFGGAWGCYDDGNQLYIRFRYLREKLARWITRDPLWPATWAYGFCYQNPLSYTDPSGLVPCVCCCCPIRIGGVGQDKQTSTRIETELTVLIRTEYVPADEVLSGDCSMSWYERTNAPYPDGTAWDGTWRDMYNNPTQFSTTLAPWTLREKGCFANGKVEIIDHPGYDLPRPNNNGTRILCIRVVVKKAPGCDCPSDQEEFTFQQFITFSNGVPIGVSHGIPSNNPYCIWTGVGK